MYSKYFFRVKVLKETVLKQNNEFVVKYAFAIWNPNYNWLLTNFYLNSNQYTGVYEVGAKAYHA